MTIKQQIAKYVTGNISIAQLPDIAVNWIKEGYDTPSLIILAGFGKNDDSFQIEYYFKLTLEEMRIELPDRRQAAIEYAIAIVDEILTGKKEIIKGISEIRYDAFESYDFFSESRQYCFDSIGFESAYGLFDTFIELSTADRPWQIEKTNEQLMAEIKTELFEDLKKWKDKIKNGA